VLLRHAEAEALRPGQSDFERTLTAHGRTQARAAAGRLRQLGLYPDALLSSPAERARRTAVIVARQLRCLQAIDYRPDLYQAGAPALLAALQHCGAHAQTLVLVAHNPGLSELAHRLTSRTASAGRTGVTGTELDPSFTLATGQLCSLELDIEHWGRLQDYCTVQKQ
jgi:phosphohistidine phosphatase